MLGYRFADYEPPKDKAQATFESLFKMFMELLNMSAGNAGEAMRWLTELDRRYGFTNESYGIGDFYDDMKRKGYIEEKSGSGEINITAKSEQAIRKSALEEIFGKLKRSKQGKHNTTNAGVGDEPNADVRSFRFGDDIDQISMTESIKNAQINHGLGDFVLTEEDLQITEKDYKTQTSTVLMIDISHSMILYGEDRITPAKKVAMALAEMITTKYKKDTLDIIVFGNDAWQIEIKDLPYLQVGPYHTNTVAGLELAMDLLRRRKNANKQIFMITDGKPTCLKEGLRYYKNSFGLDSKILSKTLNLGAQCKRIKIPITTFMIASDPYLQQFVREFTQVNGGNAYFSSLEGLGNLVFEDYRQSKKRFKTFKYSRN